MKNIAEIIYQHCKEVEQSKAIKWYRADFVASALPSEVVSSVEKKREKARPQKKQFSERPRLLSANDAATLLGLHPQTVYDMGIAGTLPSFKVGRHRKFDINALEEWIERKKEERP